MLWYQSDPQLPEHRKLQELREILGISKRDAVGLIHMLWCRTAIQADTGDLSGWKPRHIAAACEWEGDPEQLIDALQEAGFIDGGIVHDWYARHEKVFKDRERKRKSNSRDDLGDSTEPPRSLHGDAGSVAEDRGQTRLDQTRREEKKAEHTSSPSLVSGGEDSLDDLEDLAKSWYRRERGEHGKIRKGKVREKLRHLLHKRYPPDWLKADMDAWDGTFYDWAEHVEERYLEDMPRSDLSLDDLERAKESAINDLRQQAREVL